MKGKNLYKIAIDALLLAGCVFLICSCLSFNIGDTPSEYVSPHNDPTANWCGSAGAFCAYYLLKYIGPGIYVLLIGAGWALFSNLANIKITQPILRLVGTLLLTAAFSASVYLIRPESANSFPTGTGGVLGIGIGHFLNTRVAQLGTIIIVRCS